MLWDLFLPSNKGKCLRLDAIISVKQTFSYIFIAVNATVRVSI